MSASGLLEGLKIIDLGVGMAPALMAKMLAEMGAEVTRIEPDGGDPFVKVYPAYEIWHSGARRAPKSELAGLLSVADVCLIGGEDHPAIPRRRDAADIAAQHPRLVVVDLDDGPDGTSYVGPMTELLAQVRSGLVWEQEPERPIVNAFEPASYGAALQGMAGLLAAVFERESSGLGQIVSTSLWAGALAWIGSYWAKLEKPTPMADFVIPRGVWPLIFRTRDDRYIHIAIGGAGSKYLFYQALEIDDPTVLPGDSGFPKPGSPAKEFFGDWDLLAEHFAKKDCDDLLARAWERGLPAEEVLQPGECWSDPQVVHNRTIVQQRNGTRHVGLPFSSTPLRKDAAKSSGKRTKPLEGVRVVDCGAFVAGPLAGVTLADLGADVVKVEARQGDPNRGIFKSFTFANRGKRVIGVDMKNPDGIKVMQKLCARADVVMNNFRPGVAQRLGIDPESLANVNSSVIVLEAPAFGKDGPSAGKAGFDMVMQAWSGLEVKMAGVGNPPRWNRTNLVDNAGGMIGAVAALAALVHRERTGNTVSLNSPLCNAGIFCISELIQRPDGSFDGVPTLNASLTGYTPTEALYRAADGWVAIVARGDEACRGLQSALGLEALQENSIAAAVASLDLAELKASLEPHGVWVEECRDGKEQQILSDPALIAQGTVRISEHSTYGKLTELGPLFSLSRSATGNDIPSPVIGENTREVLEDLGCDDREIERLYAEKAIN